MWWTSSTSPWKWLQLQSIPGSFSRPWLGCSPAPDPQFLSLERSSHTGSSSPRAACSPVFAVVSCSHLSLKFPQLTTVQDWGGIPEESVCSLFPARSLGAPPCRIPCFSLRKSQMQVGKSVPSSLRGVVRTGSSWLALSTLWQLRVLCWHKP